MSSKNLLEIPKIIDLAFGTPEIGVVNFNILHALLHLMVKEIFNLEQNRIELIQKLDGTVEAILHDHHIKSQQDSSSQIYQDFGIKAKPSKESKYENNTSLTVFPTAAIQVAPRVYELFGEKRLNENDMVIWHKNDQMKPSPMGSLKSKIDEQNNEVISKSQSTVKSSETKIEAALKHESSKKDSAIKSENLESKSEELFRKSKNAEFVIENSNQEFEIKNSSMSQSKSSLTRIGGGSDQETTTEKNKLIKSKSSTTAIGQIGNIPISTSKTSVIYVNQIEQNADQICATSKSSMVSTTGQIDKECEHTHIIKYLKDEDYKAIEFNDDNIKIRNESPSEDTLFQNKIPMNFILTDSNPNEPPIELQQASEGNISNLISEVTFKEIISREEGGEQQNFEEKLDLIGNNNFARIYDKNWNKETKISFNKSHLHYNQISAPIRQKAGQDKDSNSNCNDEPLTQSETINTNESTSREKAGLSCNKKIDNASRENDVAPKNDGPQLSLNNSRQPKKSIVSIAKVTPEIPTDVENFNLLSKTLELRVDKVEHVIKCLNIEVTKNFNNINDRLNNLPKHSLEHLKPEPNFQQDCTLIPIKVNALIGTKKDEEANFKEKFRALFNDMMKDIDIRRGVDESIMNSTPQQAHPQNYIDNKFDVFELKNIELNEYIKDLEKQICTLNSMLINFINAQADKDSSASILVELQNEIKALKDFSDNVIKELAIVRSEREEFKDLTESIKQNLEFLNTIKLDKEEIDELLLEKADCSMLNLKLSIESYEISKSEMENSIKKRLEKIDDSNTKLIAALQAFNEQLIQKLNQSDLEELKEWVEKKFAIVIEKKNKSTPGGGQENEAAGTKIRYLKNVECLSCERTVVMRKEETAIVPFLNRAHLSSSPKAELAYKLDFLRNEIKGLPISRNLNDFNMIMNKSKAKNRFCGGSHTKISIKDNNEAGIGQGSAAETTKAHENVTCTCKN